MMKYLIIFAHPDANSLNAHMKDAVIDYLEKIGHQVVLRDLYQIGFDPILSLNDMKGQREGKLSPEVQIEQQHIQWADTLIIIHPIWWTGLPAMMKGYIDRVFSYGFAYTYANGFQEGLLKDKNAIIVNTQGKSKMAYAEIRMDKALNLTSDTGIYNYCGIHVEEHFYFPQADRVNATTLEGWLSELLLVL